MVDYYSNFWEIDRLTSTTSTAAVLKLKNHFARYGCPDRLISDNGTNGKVESAVKTAKSLLCKALSAGTDPYMAILDYCNTPTQGMDSSPAQRLMNRRTRTLLPTMETLLQPRAPQSEQNIQQLNK